MTKTTRNLVAMLLAIGICGCSDGAEPITRDCLVMWNEACDYSMKANNEESAKSLMSVEFRLLDKKKDEIAKRMDKRLSDLDKDEKKELDDTLLDYFEEIQATRKRMLTCAARLDAVIAANNPNDSLRAMKKWLLDAKLNNPGFNGGGDTVKDFGKGLVPSRPQPKKKT